MARKLDAFAIAVGLNHYETQQDYITTGDFLIINTNGIVAKQDTQLASIAKQEKYYEQAIEIVDLLLRDKTYSLAGDDYIFLEKEEIAEYFGDNDGSIGKVIFTNGNIAILYLGTADEECFFPEGDFLVQGTIEDLEAILNSMIDEGTILSNECNGEVCYSITDKGLDYLKQSEREEEKTMDNVFGKLGFGKCVDTRFALSINGIAVRQANTNKYVVYNKDSNEFVDTTDMLINIKDALFLLPATDIAVGDTVIHEGKPYYIVRTGNEIKAVSYDDCTQTVLIPKTTMFGLKYFTKVCSLFGDNFAATGELFSNPMMLMALIGGEGNADFSKMLLFSSLAKGDMASNPMLMAMLLKDDGKADFSTFAMMSMLGNGTNPLAPKAKKDDNKKGE